MQCILNRRWSNYFLLTSTVLFSLSFSLRPPREYRKNGGREERRRRRRRRRRTRKRKRKSKKEEKELRTRSKGRGRTEEERGGSCCHHAMGELLLLGRVEEVGAHAHKHLCSCQSGMCAWEERGGGMVGETSGFLRIQINASLVWHMHHLEVIN